MYFSKAVGSSSSSLAELESVAAEPDDLDLVCSPPSSKRALVSNPAHSSSGTDLRDVATYVGMAVSGDEKY